MKFKFEKSSRIVRDLMAYCHRMGATDYHIDVKLTKTIAVFLISSPIPNMTEDHLEELEETLNTPRQHEVEQNYWGLSGESEADPDLALVGMMIDQAKIDYQDGVLTIMMRRLLE